MERLSPNALVEVWARADDAPPWQKAVTLIAAMAPEHSVDEIMAWPTGFRDRVLLSANAVQFGPWIETEGRCGACETAVALRFHTDALLADDPGDAVARYVDFEWQERRLAVRPPTTADMRAVLETEDPPSMLLRRLIREDGVGDEPDTSDDRRATEALVTSDGFAEAVETRLKRMQPLTEISLNARCPECGNDTVHPFDITDHLFRRIAASARRLLVDVHLLASAYGWTGDEILSLSPARRRQHIAMVLG